MVESKMISNKELLEYTREDFNKLILEKAKPAKMISIYYRLRKENSSDHAEIDKTKLSKTKQAKT